MSPITPKFVTATRQRFPISICPKPIKLRRLGLGRWVPSSAGQLIPETPKQSPGHDGVPAAAGRELAVRSHGGPVGSPFRSEISTTPASRQKPTTEISCSNAGPTELKARIDDVCLSRKREPAGLRRARMTFMACDRCHRYFCSGHGTSKLDQYEMCIEGGEETK